MVLADLLSAESVTMSIPVGIRAFSSSVIPWMATVGPAQLSTTGSGLLCRSVKGSFSIKVVLPALFPDDPTLDYHNLEGCVHNGSEAMNIFPEIQYMTPEEQTKTRKSLLAYCCLDTFAMVKVWMKLCETIK